MSESTGKRRENGTGSVSLMKDGRWVGRIRIGYNEQGKPVIKAVYGKTENEAKRKLRDYIREMHKNDGVVVQRNTVSNYMIEWLNNNKRNALKPKSFDRLEQTLQYQVLPAIGHIQLAALTSSDIQRMINDLAAAGKSRSTIKKAYDAVNECFRTGVIQRTVTFNPALGVTLPRANPSDDTLRFFNDDEVRAITETALRKYKSGKQIYRLGDAIILDLNTGLRLSELLALKWKDVDLEKKEIYINSSIVMVKDRKDGTNKFVPLEQDSTKTFSGTRYVPLNDAAYEAILRLKALNEGFEYVISNSNGKAPLPRNIDRMFRNIQELAGFPKDHIYGPHALRHTFATRLFANGADVKMVSAILGHKDVSVTYNTYIHVIEEQKRKIIEKVTT